MTWEVFKNEILPFWMLCTKEYQYTPEFLCWSCPAEIEPYTKMYELAERKKDEFAWLQGHYMYEGTLVAIDNAFLGNKSKAKYPQKPISQQAREESGEMSHEEKMKKVRALFDRLQIMKVNYDLSHQKEEEK